jgi:hypothetical protein
MGIAGLSFSKKAATRDLFLVATGKKRRGKLRRRTLVVASNTLPAGSSATPLAIISARTSILSTPALAPITTGSAIAVTTMTAAIASITARATVATFSGLARRASVW